MNQLGESKSISRILYPAMLGMTVISLGFRLLETSSGLPEGSTGSVNAFCT